MSPARYVTPDPDDDGYDEDVLPDPSCCPALPLLLLALIGTEQRREAAKKWHGRSERAEAEHE
ncbi:hypothetical protein EMIHUDRAFT_249060 [Emiliania huxleyi CCMP1516]|uniref:Uncharacterized protein n=2 Tax=Emiliania huxleyi TaxID=2903 RepID=A0A0D3IB55_EMIH1|nr:hypothetical protein EMIHUDRAFT_249060 [Emiliania huxleyi CCMP1516]EOD08490.1 hypothetical protein EMIHUDRAFT_249060 [Emiliania huxleyi CCMP1516]|eukprot:XP_005760919.1 hypothetical protein EMIHUDRAFT_249060 [Emiliania huxleyi CCMP1516]